MFSEYRKSQTDDAPCVFLKIMFIIARKCTKSSQHQIPFPSNMSVNIFIFDFVFCFLFFRNIRIKRAGLQPSCNNHCLTIQINFLLFRWFSFMSFRRTLLLGFFVFFSTHFIESICQLSTKLDKVRPKIMASKSYLWIWIGAFGIRQ